jgi:hypothetical protein
LALKDEMMKTDNMNELLNKTGKYNKYLVFPIALLLLSCCFIGMKSQDTEKIKLVLSPDKTGLATQRIQSAIDSCAKIGGGTIVFSTGTYISGSIELKSHVSLQFEKGAVLQGSDNYDDYKFDAFIYGNELSDISISGEGIIDGVDCVNSKGEEGFRGPHCIRLVQCKNIAFKDFTIKNSANWAINCRNCSNGFVDKVSIRGGHDGLHTRFCDNFKVNNCDFRTGDDAFAGNDNRNFTITNCKINTSCNGFRIGCFNLSIKDCQLWGPGESVHKIQKRNNMLAAFVYFSPKDENPKLVSGNWKISNVTVNNVDHFFVYNFKDGLWQTGQPLRDISIENVTAKGILGAFNIIGDRDKQFKMKLQNSSFSFREGAAYKGDFFEDAKLLSPAFFNIANFSKIDIQNVTFDKKTETPVLYCKSGNLLILKHISFITERNSTPCVIDNLIKLTENKVFVNGALCHPKY